MNYTHTSRQCPGDLDGVTPAGWLEVADGGEDVQHTFQHLLFVLTKVPRTRPQSAAGATPDQSRVLIDILLAFCIPRQVYCVPWLK